MDRARAVRLVETAIAVLGAAGAVLSSLLFEYFGMRLLPVERTDRLLTAAIPLLFGSAAVLCVLARLEIRLFVLPVRWLFLLPCVLVAVNNFRFCSYFSGDSVLGSPTAAEYLLFLLYCLLVGVFEEGVFRGVIFLLVAEAMPRSRKGLICTVLLSSAVFALSHLFNLLAGAGIGPTLLQVGYTFLTGALFSFALVETKSLFSCIFLHALYDFCGLLLDPQMGLGEKIAFTVPDIALTAAVGIAVGIFALVAILRYPERERETLYARLGVRKRKTDKNSEKRTK